MTVARLFTHRRIGRPGDWERAWSIRSVRTATPSTCGIQNGVIAETGEGLDGPEVIDAAT